MPRLRGELNSEPTAREIEALRIYAVVGTYEATAAAMGIRPDTVRNHLLTLRRRLGVRNSLQAYALIFGDRAA